MNRQGHENTDFFLGTEVERTPAYGKKTLFVVGTHPVAHIEQHLDEDIDHIFFGANHSFNPKSFADWDAWEAMIAYFLNNDYLCTLDIPVALAEQFLESYLIESNLFIPQLRIPMPYIKQWNYNTMIKLDDKDFKATNPGVWCHNLHDLMDRSKYTDWKDYKGDTTL